MTNAITVTAVVFLCGFLARTNSQEPTADDVLSKVSDVIDLKSLNVSGASDLLDISSNMSLATLLKDGLKQKCEKNGKPGSYERTRDSMNDLEQCVSSFVNVTKLQEEMEKYKPTGDLDVVFKNYCRKTPTLQNCVNNFTRALEPCLEEEEKEMTRIMRNITDSLLKFVCYKEGDRIALFISANGPECLQSKMQQLQDCANATFAGYAPQNPSMDSLSNLGTLFPLVLGTKECTDMSILQACAVRELEKCSDPTPANIVDSIFNYIRRVTPCQNLTSVAKSAAVGSQSISLIGVMTLAALSLPRYI